MTQNVWDTAGNEGNESTNQTGQINSSSNTSKPKGTNTLQTKEDLREDDELSAVSSKD